jgi:uroporphyrinogen-III synthase
MEDQNTQITCGIVENSLNKKVISSLLKKERKIVEFPTFKTEKVLINEKSKSIIEEIEEFDWLIFTDVLAVDYFLEILDKLEFDLFRLDNLRICSFGESVSDRLRFVQIHSDIISSKIISERIYEEISDYISDENEFRETKFLVLKRDSKEAEITEILKDKKVFVKELIVYKFIGEKNLKLSKLKTLLIGGAIDEFIFTSPIDFFNLQKEFSRNNLQQIFSETKVFATDEITFRYLLENGLKPKMFTQK